MYDTMPTRKKSLKLRKLYAVRLVKESFITSTGPTKVKISTPVDVYAFMKPFVDQESAETLWALALDTQHQVVAPAVITRGLLNCSLTHSREVFRAMIMANACSVILCHNHPSGDPTPSPDDRRATSQLVAAGRLLDIPIHDHVIIGDGKYSSFAEMGLLY